MSRTLHIKPLVFTDRLLHAVQASPAQFLTVTQRGVQLWQIREGEVLRLRDTQLEQPLLLMCQHQHHPQTQDHVITVITGKSQPGSGAWACRMAWISQQGPALSNHDVALDMPQSQYNEATVSREPHPSCSNTICPPVSPDLSIGAVSVYKGCVHVYGINGEFHKSKQAVTQTMYDFTAVAAAADPYQEGNRKLVQLMTIDTCYNWLDQQSDAWQANALFMVWHLCLLPPLAKHYSWCA